MQMLWSRHYSNSEQFRIPKPVFLDKANSFLFLEEVQGYSFLHGFYTSAASKAEKLAILQAKVASAAQWLVDFQNIYQATEQRGIPPELMDYEAKINRMVGLTAAEKGRIARKMRDILDGLPAYRETLLTRHFLPRNLIFFDNPSKICAVDFPKMSNGWPFYDVLTFLVGLEKLELYPLLSWADCEELKRTFIAEYSAARPICGGPEIIANLWAAYVVADLQRRYQRNRGIRLKGLGNNLFVYKTARRLARWSEL
jgi:aminoglycoside/choline kinase family phosphotransferase